jgi:aconitase A
MRRARSSNAIAEIRRRLFRQRRAAMISEGGGSLQKAGPRDVDERASTLRTAIVVIAAITSCTKHLQSERADRRGLLARKGA